MVIRYFIKSFASRFRMHSWQCEKVHRGQICKGMKPLRILIGKIVFTVNCFFTINPLW